MLIVEPLPLWIDDCSIFEMFCASLRSLCEGRIGIGVGVGVTDGVEDEDGKGGGGPVGDVGTG